MSKFAKGFKDFTSDDITTIRDTLHEAIPITGTICSGTYVAGAVEQNIFNNPRDLFQSVYDYPYLSSSANHIFDIAIGYPSALSHSANTGNARKINIYNQFAQVLMGFDITGSVIQFDRDGNLDSGEKITQAYFVNFSRLLAKDEIKKQSFSLQVLTGGVATAPEDILTIQDHGAKNNYRTNGAVGEYGILYTGSAAAAGTGVGLVFYQAGVAVLSASVFDGNTAGYLGTHPLGTAVTYNNAHSMVTGSSITGSADAFRNRLYNISFNNTIDINSTVYFCRLNHGEFNYSSNRTYLSESKIVVKDLPPELPRSFITTVGLYSADNELLAVAKTSQALEKSPKNEIVIQVRLDT